MPDGARVEVFEREGKSVRIRFRDKPADEIRQALKGSGFRFVNGEWYHKLTPENKQEAERIASLV